MIELKKVKKRKKRNKIIPINIRITPEMSKFIKKYNISPTRLFEEALKQMIENLMKK